MYEIGFIGCGRMAQALINGLIAKKVFHPSGIAATDAHAESLHSFAAKVGIVPVNGNKELVAQAKVLVLAVKPQNFPDLSAELAGAFGSDKLLISIVTGVSLAKLFPLCRASVRVMPNTPALVGSGAAGFCTTTDVSAAQAAFAQRLLDSVGMSARVDESLMDVVTGLSGSGPAYIYLVIQALADAGTKLGLDPKLALQLSVQTVKGAALMVEQTGESPSKLRDQVTSPGGTTLEGLKVLDANQASQIFYHAVKAATNRAKELGAQ